MRSSGHQQGGLTSRVVRLLFRAIEQNGPDYLVAQRAGIDKGQLSRIRKRALHLGVRHLEALLLANGTTEPTFWGQLYFETRFRAADAHSELLGCANTDPEGLPSAPILKVLQETLPPWRDQSLTNLLPVDQGTERLAARAAILALDDERLIDSAAAQTAALTRIQEICAAPFSREAAADLAILLALWGAARRVEGARHDARIADLLALELLPAARDRFAEGFVLQKVAWVLVAYNRLGQANLALDQASHCYLLAACSDWLAKTTVDQGHFALMRGDFDAAEEWLNSSLSLVPETLPRYRYATHDLLTRIHLQRGELDLALWHVRQASTYAPAAPHARGYLKWREGTLLVQLKQFGPAEALLEQAIEALSELGEPLDLAIATWDLAVVYQVQQQRAKLQGLKDRTFAWLHRLRADRAALEMMEDLLATVLRGDLTLDWLMRRRASRVLSETRRTEGKPGW